jgi:hypothetical protein
MEVYYEQLLRLANSLQTPIIDSFLTTMCIDIGYNIDLIYVLQLHE